MVFFAGLRQFIENHITPIKREFDKKVENLMRRKKSNSAYLMTHLKYQEIISEVRETKEKWNKDFVDFRMLANYDILKVNGVDRLIQPKTDVNPHLKFYVHVGELFSVLHTMHLLLKHAGREQMDKELKTKYCNVSKEAIRIYLTCCKICNEKYATEDKDLSSVQAD